MPLHIYKQNLQHMILKNILRAGIKDNITIYAVHTGCSIQIKKRLEMTGCLMYLNDGKLLPVAFLEC